MYVSQLVLSVLLISALSKFTYDNVILKLRIVGSSVQNHDNAMLCHRVEENNYAF